jgi:hypothetical protein
MILIFSYNNLGTGKIADGEEHACSVHLPFAGITLFRFYGCNLSPYTYCIKAPREKVTIFE